MKFAAVMLVAAGLAAAGSASASASAFRTDMDYLKASRCKGIAQGLGAADTGNLDAALKADSRRRDEVIVNRGHDEMMRAKRQAADANMKDKLSAELANVCTAYMGPNKNVATR